ncbi:MAG: metallophosphoesterase [bacterium]|nr:metallophosphoesterase [bacterium]
MKVFRALIPFLFIAPLIYLMNAYSLAGIRPLINRIESATLQQVLIGLYWLIPYLSLFFTVVGLRNMQKNHGLGYWGNLGFNSLITLFFTQLSIIGIVVLGDFVRLFEGLYFWVENKQFVLPERNFMTAIFAVLISTLPFGFFVYGIVKGKYKYKVHKHVLSFSDLPEAFDGFKISQISDIHSGSLDNEKAVSLGIDLINELKSDLFLFTGDLVNNDAEEFIPWKTLFSKIKAPFGQFSVLGNHDYGDYKQWPSEHAKQKNRQDIINHHESVGFKLMQDEHVEIEKDGQKISLIGVQNWGHGFIQAGDLTKALYGINKDSFKILLSHDPTHFEHEVKNHETKIHLTLAGHTHGMQMGIELPWFKWSPVKLRYKRWAGIYQENGRFLNINRGFGFLGFSGRVGIWPEISLIELRRA